MKENKNSRVYSVSDAVGHQWDCSLDFNEGVVSEQPLR